MNDSLGPQTDAAPPRAHDPRSKNFSFIAPSGVRRRRRLHTQWQIAVMYNLDISALPPPSKYVVAAHHRESLL
jgi:hypothetical protein